MSFTPSQTQEVISLYIECNQSSIHIFQWLNDLSIKHEPVQKQFGDLQDETLSLSETKIKMANEEVSFLR